MSRREKLEKQIQGEIEAAIGAEPDVLLLRNSVGQATYVDERSGKTFRVPYGLGKGSPDLVALLRHPAGFAVWFCLEVKPPEGVLEPDQTKAHAVWRRFGAVIETVRSAEEARQALQAARSLLRRAA